MKPTFFEKIYNHVFLFYYETFDRDIASLKKTLDSSIMEIALGFNLNLIPEKKDIQQKIRVLLIQEYLKVRHLELEENRKAKLMMMAVDVQRVFCLNFLPESPLFSKEDFQMVKSIEFFFLESQSCYTEKISSDEKNSNDEKILFYMKDPRVKELAEKIDKKMEDAMTLKAFAALIYDARDVIHSLFPKGSSFGADEKMNIVLAICLLQKNPLFFKAVNRLFYHSRGDGRLDYLEAEISYYKNIHTMIFTNQSIIEIALP